MRILTITLITVAVASVAGAHIIDGMGEQIARHASPAAAEAVTIVAGTLGERADLLGAVALMQRE